MLLGIENILSVASDLVQEVDPLKGLEEECQMLKEKLFMKQFTSSEQDVFALDLMVILLKKCKIFCSKKRTQLRLRDAAFYKN